MPKLSIITVNLNNAAGLRKTIESVINQTFTDYEYLVIDGDSTDGSVEIIKENADKIKYWVSEPDKGIYSAMNKGIKESNSDYLIFLNSGDSFSDESVLKDFISSNFTYDLIYGDMYCAEQKIINTYPDILTSTFLFETSLGHPSMFFKKELFNKFGYYNENHRIVSDWEFYLNALIKNNASYFHFNRLITNFDEEGVSSGSTDLIQMERNDVLENNYKLFLSDYLAFSMYKKKLIYYENSRLVQIIKKLQFSKIYKMLRNANYDPNEKPFEKL